MRSRSILTAFVTGVLLLTFGASGALAQRCPDMCQVYNGSANQTFRCDALCTAGVACKASDTSDICPAKCTTAGGATNNQVCELDSDCTNPSYPFCNFFGDGKITLCGSTGNDIIQGNGADNVACGNGGADDITGGGGNDFINGGAGADVIDAGTGNDVVEGGDGFDVIVGGGGTDDLSGNRRLTFTADGGNNISGGAQDDIIIGAGGDDLLVGDTGDDLIIGQGGRDVIKGGDGVDFMIGNYGGPTANDVLGSLYCGGKGDDTILADGTGHQCVDGGPDQAVSGSESDCQYSNLPNDTDDHDVGTAINCANPTKTSTNGTLLTATPDCGCMD